MSSQDKRVTVRVEELAYSNLMTLNALVELLEEKGVVTKQEVLDRVKRRLAQTLPCKSARRRRNSHNEI